VPWDCVRNSWEVVKPDKLRFIGGIFVLFLLLSCLPCFGYLLFGPVMAGIYFVFLLRMENKSFFFNDFFKGFEQFWPTVGVGLIQLIPDVIYAILYFAFNSALEPRGSRNIRLEEFLFAFGFIFLVYFILSITFKVLLIFALPLVVERRLGVLEAIKLSIKAALRNLGGIIVLIILQILISIPAVLPIFIIWAFVLVIALIPFLGVFLSIFGIICLIAYIVIAFPLLGAVVLGSNVFAYRQVFPKLDSDDIFHSPPPPTAYGSEYGTAM
jgi:hypothetical protein